MNFSKLSIFLCLSLVCACTPKAKEVSSTDSPSQKKAAQDDKTYMVSLPSAGSPLIITPITGYKINADFPHRAQLTAGAVKETAVMTHDEKKLTFQTPEASKLPQTGVQAELSFSVCNDHMCKLYQEKVQW